MPAHRSAEIDDPREFAGYDLMHCLGRGGMGEVWSVVRRGLYDITRALAIKAMLPELSSNAEYCEIFVTEGRIAMQLSSANIVPVFELGRHDGLLFMVMQRIDGVNLADFQRRTRNVYNTMPLDVALYVIGEVLAALFVAHEHTVAGQPAGVIHRDIKPANVLISSSGDVRLTDFGIARPATPHSFRVMPIGTLRYVCREQAEGRAERASDLFSVGAILHELLSGRQFREGAHSEEQLYRAIFNYKEIPPVGRVVPEDVERLRRGLLHPDPKQRFQTAADAMDCLSECVGYRYSRLRLARIYETSIGMRSSGFTETHSEAMPSFLLNRKSRPNGSNAGRRGSFVYNRVGEGRETSFKVDEDASTALHVPWQVLAESAAAMADEEAVDEPTSLYMPVMARQWQDRAGPHPVAPEPARPTDAVLQPSVEVEESDRGKARALTPTLQLLLPVGHGHAPHLARGLSTPEPTEAVAAPPRPTIPMLSTSEVPGPEPGTPRETCSASPATDRSDPRSTASTSGTIDAPDQAPELDRAAKPVAPQPARPASATPSRLYYVVVVALLCALVGVSIAWFLDSKGTAGAEAKP